MRKKPLSIKEIKQSVERTARDFDLERVVLFGSYANGKRTGKSDIDLLVSFSKKTKKPVSYFTLFDFQHRIEELTGKKVDAIFAPIPKDSLLEINKEVLLYEAS